MKRLKSLWQHLLQKRNVSPDERETLSTLAQAQGFSVEPFPNEALPALQEDIGFQKTVTDGEATQFRFDIQGAKFESDSEKLTPEKLTPEKFKPLASELLLAFKPPSFPDDKLDEVDMQGLDENFWENYVFDEGFAQDIPNFAAPEFPPLLFEALTLDERGKLAPQPHTIVKRPPPNVTWKNLAPPYCEYEYFQGHERYPFHPGSERFDLVNAWWLAETAALVYADEHFVRSRFAQAGFPEVRHFDGESTDCFVAANDRVVLLAFRGTESRLRPGSKDSRNIWADVKVDIDALLVSSGEGVKVHQGFQRALDEVWDELAAYLTQIQSSSRPLWMSGHSLGAALATLAAERYRNVQGLYTFGSPRVGDTHFLKHFPVRAYRLVHNTDIVTVLPPPGFYAHVGELWHIDRHGGLHQNPGLMDTLSDGVRAEAENIRQALAGASLDEFQFIPGGIKDHVPLFYAVHLWNALQDAVLDPKSSS